MVKISVLVPFYNSALFIKPCIDSVLKQTFKNFELILLNDGSTDNSEEIVMQYHDKRIKYYKNEKNMGIPISHNILLDYAEGEYAAVLDSDNICLPERLQKQAEFLDNHPDVTVVGSWGELFNDLKEEGIWLKIKKMIVNMGWIWRQPYEVSLQETLRGNTCMHSSMMIRLADFKNKNIRYNPDFAVAEDYDLLRQILTNGLKIRNIQEVLFKYRLFGANISITKKKLMRECDAKVKADIVKFLNIRNYHRYPYFLIIARKLRLKWLLKWIKL
ncbi:MAG: glycosyltransferase family 2 protein [Alphaproteobacteria bacterium]|nr:glycosyltransferase family 2 protein [Alphaproteobacteria bacterium]